MQPTNELRFIERELPYPEVRTVRILQQKWANEYTYPDERTTHVESEWRDVPCVKELDQ